MSSKYAISILASAERSSTAERSVRRYNAHSVRIVEANSEDEAVGMGLRIAHKTYPVSVGWFGHSVGAMSFDSPPTLPDGDFTPVVPGE